ncbi:Short-chain dehydrogenase reductase SDR protein [Rutstroemia sp. NJR-2017a BVV2]|nr:Short-chain dehydrogenase reductase SDR protein [Rutstroemia sp. NJR-2017a BVV2]
MPNTIYLITGANRGIGRGIAEKYLSQPNTTIIAAVRDAQAPTSKELNDLPKGQASQLIVVEIDAANEEAPALAAKELSAKHNIDHIDILIANAAIGDDYSTVAEVPLATVKKHVEINAYGPLLLFQAFFPMLSKSKSPKFVAIGTPLGSITGMESRPYTTAAYGSSKAMLHWMVRKIHQENENLVAFVVDPGFVQSDMGNTGARRFGMEEAFITIEGSANFIVKTIDESTREKTSGHFPSIDGGDFPF